MTTTTETTKAICIWPDMIGERQDDGSPRWIVSLDELELPYGYALTTNTLDVLDSRDEALESARNEASRRRLPIYENAEHSAAVFLEDVLD